jgi:methyl-accepting chemotaxis protein
MAVGKKLTICIAGMLAVVLTLAGAGWYSNRNAASQLKFATATVAARAIIAGEMRANVITLREKQRGMLMYALGRDNKRANSNRAEFQDYLRAARSELAAARALSTAGNGKTMLASVDADLDKYSAGNDRIWRMIAAGKVMSGLANARDVVGPIGAHMEGTAHEYIGLQKVQLADTEASAESLTASAHWISGIFVAIGLVVIGLIAFVVRKITDQLRTIASSLSDGTGQIAAGSSQVSTSSQSLAQGASEQASSLEETSASAEEITSMTRQNAAHTSQAALLMTTVDHRVAEGNSTLALMIKSMKQINESSGKISKIIKVIDEIAFQTNILALNAAVEAARAGEAGMGFAVVANEVRNLAQRSAQAAKDTAALIEESIATSNQGSAQLQKVADVVGSITEAATKVKLLVDEVNIGSQEQSKGIEEIARSLAEMDKVTQGTAAAAEQSAAASEQMSAQAQSLTHIVEELRTMAGSAK